MCSCEREFGGRSGRSPFSTGPGGQSLGDSARPSKPTQALASSHEQFDHLQVPPVLPAISASWLGSDRGFEVGQTNNSKIPQQYDLSGPWAEANICEGSYRLMYEQKIPWCNLV